MLSEAVAHINFCVKIYMHQMKQGFLFVHEHRLGARSWNLSAMHKLMNNKEVYQIRADMCMFGMATTSDDGQRMPVKKPTRFLTNSWAIADELDKKCDGNHRHHPLRTRAESERC